MDNNKTHLTNQITTTVCHFLSNRGFEIIEAENSYSSSEVGKPCPLCKVSFRNDCWECGGTGKVTTFFLADVSAFGSPSRTQLQNCGVKIGYNDKLEIEMPVCALVEVKQQKSDFTREIETKFSTTYAHLNYIAYPLGLLKKEEIPDGWFGLETTKDGRRIYRLRRAKGQLKNPNTAEIKQWVTSIALRRYNRQTYQWWRDLQRELDGKEKIRTTPAVVREVLDEIRNSLITQRDLKYLADRITRPVRKLHLFPEVYKSAKELQEILIELQGDKDAPPTIPET